MDNDIIVTGFTNDQFGKVKCRRATSVLHNGMHFSEYRTGSRPDLPSLPRDRDDISYDISHLLYKPDGKETTPAFLRGPHESGGQTRTVYLAGLGNGLVLFFSVFLSVSFSTTVGSRKYSRI